jgi:hypothetical protein
MMEPHVVQIDFMAQLSHKFITKCLNDIILLKNPVYEKKSYETEPVGTKVLVVAQEIKHVIAQGCKISIEIPLSIHVYKIVGLLVGSLVQEIDFAITIKHTFGVTIATDFKISIIDSHTEFEWPSRFVVFKTIVR